MSLLVASLVTFTLIAVCTTVSVQLDLYSPGDFVMFVAFFVAGIPVALLLGASWQVSLAVGSVADLIWHVRALVLATGDYYRGEVQRQHRRTR